jgi:hypothetical protein
LKHIFLHGNQLTGQEDFGAFMEEANPGCNLSL